MYQFNFERLDVWKKSRVLAKVIYISTKGFPDEEKYCLTTQIRRAIISTCSNISEGASRISKNEQRHFYEIAYSSLMECMNQLIIASDLKYLEETSLNDIREQVQMISYMLVRLRGSIM